MPTQAHLRLLIHQIADGDRAAFAELFGALAPGAYADLAGRGLVQLEAEHIVSATFVEVWRQAHLHTGRSAEIERWISGIVARRGAERRFGTDPIEGDANAYGLAKVALADLLGPLFYGDSQGRAFADPSAAP